MGEEKTCPFKAFFEAHAPALLPHRGKIGGVLFGALFGLAVLIFGFWQTLFVLFCCPLAFASIMIFVCAMWKIFLMRCFPIDSVIGGIAFGNETGGGSGSLLWLLSDRKGKGFVL